MSDQQPIEIRPRPTAGNVSPPTGPTDEDNGSQALSEALQSSFLLVKIMMGLLVLVFFGSGFFTVKSGQQAIILRFGRPVGEGEKALLGPGAHWAFPPPIDEIQRVSIGERQTASSTIGMPWGSNQLDVRAPSEPKPSLNPAVDGYTLTADANIIHATATINYRVTDPIRYLFDYTNSAQFVTNALNNALVYASTRFTVDDILNAKRVAFRECVERRVRDLIEKEQLGVTVEQVNASPYAPGKLKATFEEVTRVGDSRKLTNNQAASYATEKLNQAYAAAHARTNIAQSDADAYVRMVQAEVKQFCDILDKFEADRDLYFQSRQLEVLGRVLANVKEKMYISKRFDGKPLELRLQLSREPDEPPPPPSE